MIVGCIVITVEEKFVSFAQCIVHVIVGSVGFIVVGSLSSGTVGSRMPGVPNV